MKKQGDLLQSSKRKASGGRLVAAFVSLCMVLTMLPTMAFADEIEAGQEPVCTCTTLCTEGHVNADCPVCSAEGADLSACKARPGHQPDDSL